MRAGLRAREYSEKTQPTTYGTGSTTGDICFGFETNRARQQHRHPVISSVFKPLFHSYSRDSAQLLRTNVSGHAITLATGCFQNRRKLPILVSSRWFGYRRNILHAARPPGCPPAAADPRAAPAQSSEFHPFPTSSKAIPTPAPRSQYGCSENTTALPLKFTGYPHGFQ